MSFELLDAASRGDIETLSCLVNHGGDVNFQVAYKYDPRSGYTPLMCSALNNHIAAMDWLINHGAIIDTQDNEGRSAFSLACIYQSYDAVDLLIKRGNPIEEKGGWALLNAASNNDAKLINLLLDAGAPIDYSFAMDGMTPFLLACQIKSLDAVTTLIKRGASTRILCNDGRGYSYYAGPINGAEGINDYVDALIEQYQLSAMTHRPCVIDLINASSLFM